MIRVKCIHMHTIWSLYKDHIAFTGRFHLACSTFFPALWGKWSLLHTIEPFRFRRFQKSLLPEVQGHSLTPEKWRPRDRRAMGRFDPLTQWKGANSPSQKMTGGVPGLECFCSSLLNLELGEVGPATKIQNEGRTHGEAPLI